MCAAIRCSLVWAPLLSETGRGCGVGEREGWTWSRSVARAIWQGRGAFGKEVGRAEGDHGLLGPQRSGLGLDPSMMRSLRGRR